LTRSLQTSIALLWSTISVALPASSSATQSPQPSGVTPTELAVVVNLEDPLSRAIGAYYARKRHIPRSNIVTARFDYRRDELAPREFAALKNSIDRQLGPRIQAYALTWARPYRVGCMSITSAFAFGVQAKYCADGCKATAANPYFDTFHKNPYEDLHMRPAMSIAAVDFDHARQLIDRSVEADGTAPQGTAYLMSTKDPHRDNRTVEYPLAERVGQHEFNFRVVSGGPASNLTDVMFYFTGAEAVQGLDTDGFLAGAIADHLTSFGGMLTDSPQMSSLRWLEAGASGSYGTVVEPCNILGKFPDVPVLMAHYLAGETLLESYWKSVLMPGQGIFIGEPLAAPFRAPQPASTKH
jgi:uncharacterized protein (TIGR03790 family)